MQRGVPQGSAISPCLFNFYLEHAIYDSKVLKLAAEEGNLLAFADDLLLVADSTDEVVKYLLAIEKWIGKFGLEVNKTKTVFMTNKKTMNGRNEIRWVKRVESFKYLGINISLSTLAIRKSAKIAIEKNLKIMGWKLKKVKDWRVKETILWAYFRSLAIYHCTSLLIANIINHDFILNLERKAFRAIGRIPNYFNNDLIQDWTQGKKLLATILKLASKVERQKLGLPEPDDFDMYVRGTFGAGSLLGVLCEDKRKRDLEVNRVHVKSHLLKLGFAICKDTVIPDHRSFLECHKHKCKVDSRHLS